MALAPQPKLPDTSVTELFAAELASVLNAMTGEQPGWEASPPEPAPASGRHVGWQQSFSDASFGPAYVWTPYEAAVEIGNRMLRAAGVTDEDEAGAADTYLEIVRQALSSLARALSARAGKEIACIDGGDRQTPSDAHHVRLRLKFPDGGAADCYVHFPAQPPEEKTLRAAAAPPPEEAVASTLERSKTLDLLLDVELPVSISFRPYPDGSKGRGEADHRLHHRVGKECRSAR